MAIKTSLKQLVGLFGQSAATDALAKPIRTFAAQLTILAAHVDRVENKSDATGAKLDAVAKHLDKQIADLAGVLIAMQQPKEAAPAVEQQTAAPRGKAPPAIGGSEESEPEDAEDEDLVAMSQRQIEEDLAELNGGGAPEPAPIVVTPPRKNGGKKSPNAGGVA